MNVAAGIDRFQQKYPAASFPLAVVYKYFDDQGNYLAATLTYYAFVSIFPLMLLGTSILGFVLRGRPQLQQQIIDSVLSRFPIIGDEIGRPDGLQGSTSGLIVGVAVALYGALGLGQALQNTLHVAWSVPRNSRPNPLLSRLKSLILLVTVGFALLVLTAVSAIGTAMLSRVSIRGWDWLNPVLRWGIPIATILITGAMLSVLFRLGSARRDSVVRTAPGGFALAVMWQVLQIAGAQYVSRVLVGSATMTRTFALVLGLIGFIFIGAVMAVMAMEINVVLTRHLYPRAVLTPFTDNVELTAADKRAYRNYARAQRHKGFETVSVRFGKKSDDDDDDGDTLD
ncbi:YihY/virulence factor BrkB family protein [Antrihabitans cavernicola]|uniref:YihY/virulence factor BrkB family protein n=1 Tax=Antrihabitans cavernicola TaxID=2495913 RepID=A0A5A7SFT7_9NOCA|nr:YihY/virulence factor BrkB family protein [Spelaeibacter cavernicola]KAA0024434.1 YihY/virulence factor BrkB family protein [Spelaeibacter cavernicola]